MKLLDKVNGMKDAVLRITAEVLLEDESIILELQKDQLYAGRNAKGELLTPSYKDDPYFKNAITAEKYAKMKSSLTARNKSSLFGDKPYYTPDLIITGTLFYNTLLVNVVDDKLIFDTQSPIISKLEAKYSDLLGWSDKLIAFYRDTYFQPKFNKKFDEWLKS